MHGPRDSISFNVKFDHFTMLLRKNVALYFSTVCATVCVGLVLVRAIQKTNLRLDLFVSLNKMTIFMDIYRKNVIETFIAVPKNI